MNKASHSNAPSADAVSGDEVVERSPVARQAPRSRARSDTSPVASTVNDDGPKAKPVDAQRVPKTRSKRIKAPYTKAARENESVEQTSIVEDRPRKRRRVEVESAAGDIEEHQPIFIDDHVMDMDIDASLQDSRGKERSLSLQTSTHDQTAGSEEMAMDRDTDYNNIQSREAEESHNDEDAVNDGSPSPDPTGSSANEKAVSTDVTSATEDDEPHPEPSRQEQRQNVLGSSVRPRRSRGRVSYVVDAFSDEEPEVGDVDVDEEESDAFMSNASDETDEDEDFVFANLAIETSSAEEENSAEEDVEEELEGEDIIPTDNGPIKSKPRSKTKKALTQKLGKGIDLNLPPLNTIEDAFIDMAAKAMQLGISDVLKELNGRHINVATMCSGTESPLLALDLLSKGLEKAGQPPIEVRHHFSAEIEVMKQGYIERNFSPSKLFRDVRDFLREETTTATTAYGSEERIPSGLDILVAGFVCKDLSQLNSKRKDLEGDGESGDTFRALYSYVKRFRPGLVLIENVMSKKTVWQAVVAKWDKIDYEATWLICDTKNYYLPQTRLRMYMIVVDRRQYGEKAVEVVEQWQAMMQKLQRQCSSPYEAFLANKLLDSSDHTAIVSEPDWALCKLRYDHIRSEERLGILRPVTRWNENGTVR